MTDGQKKKKGFLAAIWESMTRTGGCCGSGEDCCGASQQAKKNETTDKKEDAGPEACSTSGASSCEKDVE